MRQVDLYAQFTEKIMATYRFFIEKKKTRHYYQLFKLHNIPKKTLTHEQKQSVKNLWGGVGLIDYNSHILAYTVTGEFNPMIMPEILFRTKIELKLNDSQYKYVWSDKNYFDLFFPEVRFCDTLVRNINGTFYDKDYKIITVQDAKDILDKENEFIIKPSNDTGRGKGVTLHTSIDNIDRVFVDYGKNFIVQRRFYQHETISRMNPSSVNIIRYITIKLNDKVHPVMGALRVGAEGALNDASITEDGKGMIVIGIDDNGRLKDKAYYLCGLSIPECPNGTKFTGVEIPGYDKIKDIAVKAHEKMGHFGFVGWDFVIDTEGNPVVMEYNLQGPGVLPYQYVNGPLFGEYTQELIDSFKK